MNVEDTKKAMKCCMKTYPLCHSCPLKGTCITGQRKPLKKALALINRYEAEIGELTALANQLEVQRDLWMEKCEELKAEIEELTVNMNAFGLGMKREKERADTAKAEAIKEFAERLKEHFSGNYSPLLSSIMADKIDTLVKEMTEEQK